ncbi:fimbria/pilus outer membrane usher protein [Pseudomonas gessardii]|uniref:fimbria/pilus outer membrane usher protein n=1 Tax=Pseudomonas gessardii TaxID=78544 RepID=UPI0014744108|nr:fimbria/pilus outer membrane usher protein [Pseudomonas gessardii]NNA68308.1 fimbrial biogenesis outer membrane usher protein [Pseudomonas gessardii]
MQIRVSPRLSLRQGSISLLMLLCVSGLVAAEPANTAKEVQFSDDFLRAGKQAIDTRRFSKGNVAPPGQYRVDLYVNKSWLAKTDITLRAVGEDKGDAQPCFDRDLLERIHVDLGKLSPQASALLAQGSTCAWLPMLIPDATAVFDFGEQRLDISVPQIAMSRSARGYVDPQFWDEGVTAARLGYNANLYRSDSAGTSSTQSYVGLNSGVNMGAWRLRHDGNYSQSPYLGGKYQSIQTNLQRSVAPLDSQLVIGQAYTDGSMFESVGLRGVQLATDDRMRPDSQRGYAPIIHGIARSNAVVQIRQNGNLIYETNVAPGAFEINDLYPTGYGGDLEVVVTEADGSVHLSKVPYAAPVNSVREGVTRYSLSSGKYDNPGVDESPWLVQGTLQHGFTNMLTGYGGVRVADGYSATLGGMALNTRLGAFGVDITHAVAQLYNQPGQTGQSVRLSYSKLLAPTNTNIAVAAYRYSSSGYLDFQDAVMLNDAQRKGTPQTWDSLMRRRGQMQVTVNQSLPEGYGNFYASGSSQDYWDRSGRDVQYQFGYNNNYKQVSYSVSASRQLDITQDRWDNTLMLTIGFTLGSGGHPLYSTTTVQKSSSGHSSLQEGVSGTLGKDNNFSYGMNASRSDNQGASGSTNMGGNASYISSMARVSGSVSHSSGYSQMGASLSGGVVAYDGGVVFTPSLGETSAIVEADDAVGARITNASGLRVDPWGHAVVSGLTPYARNQVEIDPKGLPVNVEMKSTMEQVAPTAGAVVKLKFETVNSGRAVFLRLTTAQGQSLPFGAQVFAADGSTIGTVAQGGRLIARGLKTDSGVLNVKWSDASPHACRVDYQLPARVKGDEPSTVAISAVCQPIAADSGTATLASQSNE